MFGEEQNGTQAATIVMLRLAEQLTSLRKQREEVASEVERLVHAHPLWPVLTSRHCQLVEWRACEDA
jgi:hypothetical protein